MIDKLYCDDCGRELIQLNDWSVLSDTDFVVFCTKCLERIDDKEVVFRDKKI